MVIDRTCARVSNVYSSIFLVYLMPEIDFTNINAHIYSFVEVYSVNPLKKNQSNGCCKCNENDLG